MKKRGRRDDGYEGGVSMERGCEKEEDEDEELMGRGVGSKCRTGREWKMDGRCMEVLRPWMGL